MRRITLLISSLVGGGAERLNCALAAGLDSRGHLVSVVTLSGYSRPAVPLPGEVRVYPLDVMGESGGPAAAVLGNWRRTRAVRETVAETAPDVLISSLTETNVLAAVATRLPARAPWRLVIWEHEYPPMAEIKPLWRVGRRVTFRWADAAVAASKGAADSLRTLLHCRNVACIHDPVLLHERGPDAEAALAARALEGTRWVLGMGRLAPVKGFDLLIDAFARIPPDSRAGWKLGIIGEGPLRDELERLIEARGLTGDARLLGSFRNPAAVLRAGAVFALTSRHEGFGMALAEAMACGLAAVSFRCPCGPEEIVRHGTDGLLVPPEDVDAFAGALEELMQDEVLRERLGGRATEAARRFSKAAFLDRWEKLIEELARAGAPAPGGAG